jgi:chromosome segregation ATPase
MPAENLTTAQACARANVTRFALLRAQKKGDIFGIKDNKGEWLWDGEALDRWAKDRPERPERPEPEPVVPPPAFDPTDERVLLLTNEVSDLREALGRAEGTNEGLRTALDTEAKRAKQAIADTERAHKDAKAERTRAEKERKAAEAAKAEAQKARLAAEQAQTAIAVAQEQATAAQDTAKAATARAESEAARAQELIAAANARAEAEAARAEAERARADSERSRAERAEKKRFFGLFG